MSSAPAVWTRSHLIEIDFSGIEAVLVGFFARDPIVYRMAKLGLHAYVASHLVQQPVSLQQSDEDIAEAFAAIKAAHKGPYNKAKRNVHGTGYGMTPRGMVLMFPELYRSEAEAKHVQDVYFSVAPGVKPWQGRVQQRAHDQGYLGGPPAFGYNILTDENAHPFGYKHYFYGVLAHQPLTDTQVIKAEREHRPIFEMNGRWYETVLGPEAKSCIAFYPQSTAAGILKEVLLALFANPDHPNYIGRAWYGRTPLRAPIHDSILLEAPPRQIDRVLEATYGEMLRPIEEMPIPPEWGYGTHVTIGVEGKMGRSWDQMEKIPTPPGGWKPASAVVGDRTYFPATEAEEEDVMDLMVEQRAKVLA
jgi:hypothetical protein